MISAYLVCNPTPARLHRALLAPPPPPLSGQFYDRYPLLAACEGDRLPCVQALLEARASLSMSVANVSPARSVTVPTRVTAIKQGLGAAPCNI